jgi:hypothetical protein
MAAAKRRPPRSGSTKARSKRKAKIPPAFQTNIDKMRAGKLTKGKKRSSKSTSRRKKR